MHITRTFIVVLLAAACGSHGVATTPPDGGNSTPAPTTKTVGSGGGTISAPDGTSIVFPPNALSGDTTISMTANAQPPALPGGSLAAGAAWEFEPSGQYFLNAQPTVTMVVDPAKLPAGMALADVRLVHTPHGTSDYTALNTAVIDATHVSARTYSFSDFLPAVASAAGPCVAGPNGSKCCRDPLGDSSCVKFSSNGSAFSWQCTGSAILSLNTEQGKNCTSISGQYDAWCCSKAQ